MTLATDPADVPSLRAQRLPPSLSARASSLVELLDRGGVELRLFGPDVGAPARAAALRDDLRAGHVATADGTMRYDAATVVDVPTWRFDGPAPATLCCSDAVFRRPLPGPVRLYFLPRSGLVVGAESPSGFDPVQQYRARLLEMQRVGHEDLAALHTGRASQRVSARIARAAFRIRLMAWMITGLCPLMLGVAFLQGAFAPEQGVVVGGVGIGWTAIVSPIVLLVAFVLHAKASGIARAQSEALLFVEGNLSRGRTRSNQNHREWIEIEGEQFEGRQSPLVDELWQHVIPGWPCRAYITGRARMLVLIEPLPAPGCALTRG